MAAVVSEDKSGVTFINPDGSIRLYVPRLVSFQPVHKKQKQKKR
ncbi:hypothetical protein [Enterobacter sp.]|nr:hypothetical protein [Enterobacter sp.]